MKISLNVLLPSGLGQPGNLPAAMTNAERNAFSLLFLPLVQESANNALLFFLLSDSEEAV